MSSDPGNPATHLRDYMDHTAQKKWGFVIYRCTYDDDAAWTRFLEIFHARVRGSLDIYSGDEKRGVLEKLDVRVMADRETLDGASKDDVRARFATWVISDEAMAEQGDGDVPYQESLYIGSFCPRYSFCVHVDSGSLDSVVNKAPQPPEWDADSIGYVNLVELIFHQNLARLPADSLSEEQNGEEELYEPIEGCTKYQVGWMKFPLDGLAPEMYAVLQNPHSWYIRYERPPAVGSL